MVKPPPPLTTKPSTSTQKPLSPARYLEPVLAVGIILTCLNALRVLGGVIDRRWFTAFQYLLHLHFGLYGCALLATLLYVPLRLRIPAFLRVATLAAFWVWFVWIIVWVLVRRAFGIELSPEILGELLTNRNAIAAVGLGEMEFGVAVASTLLLGGILGTVCDGIARHSNPKLLRVGCIVFVALFGVVHLALRTHAYLAHRANEPILVMYHDYIPALLHMESASSGGVGDRPALPSLESRRRTEAYFDVKRTQTMPQIPRPQNIVWINLESLRFDAINEETMPRLMRYAERFQFRLDRQHWSGGNATQFGIFSELTGLSGYHLHNASRFGMPDPFLTLLEKNGYRLRVAKKNQLSYIGLSVLLPPRTVQEDIDGKDHAVKDRLMVDRYLQDRAARVAGARSFDFLAFDATHWPYPFPPEHAVFQPVSSLSGSQMILGFPEELEVVRNCYRNACHFVDEQIGRVLDDLEAHDDFASSIVIVTGDHGEEFQERGQMTHAAVLNDFQGRTVLWMHLPFGGSARRQIDVPTTHMDIVPTILQALGFDADILYTQGRSWLSQLKYRAVLALSDTGFRVPLYRALVTDTYISRWSQRPLQYVFSSAQRRDGAPVESDDWRREAEALNAQAAEMYELLPDVSQPPRKFIESDAP